MSYTDNQYIKMLSYKYKNNIKLEGVQKTQKEQNYKLQIMKNVLSPYMYAGKGKSSNSQKQKVKFHNRLKQSQSNEPLNNNNQSKSYRPTIKISQGQRKNSYAMRVTKKPPFQKVLDPTSQKRQYQEKKLINISQPIKTIKNNEKIISGWNFTKQAQQIDKQPQKMQTMKKKLSPVSNKIVDNLFRNELDSPYQQSDQSKAAAVCQSSANSRSSSYSNAVTRSRFQKQYKKHFQDCQNVFYEDTSEMTALRWINACVPVVFAIWGVLLLSCLIVWQINPYEKPCPRHAVCGAYVQCHKGYILTELELCQVDPQIKQRADVILNSVVYQMQLDYGEKQCQILNEENQNQSHIQRMQRIQNAEQPPKQFFKDVFQTQNIDQDVLQQQLIHAFRNPNYQKLLSYKIGGLGQIIPLKKAYSFTCSINLFYKQHKYLFAGILAGLVTISLGLVWFVYSKYLEYKAQSNYKYLLSQIMQDDGNTINVMEYFKSNSMSSKDRARSGGIEGKEISEKLWILINEKRVKDGLIGSYQDSQSLKWTLINKKSY